MFAFLIPIIITAFSFAGGKFDFNFRLITYMPVWLPLAWGTTVVALRKFFLVING